MLLNADQLLAVFPPSPPTDNSGADTTSLVRRALSPPTDNSGADVTNLVRHAPSPPTVNSEDDARQLRPTRSFALDG